MSKLSKALLGGIISCLVVFIIFWVFKTISYNIFYESMVESTIEEMVKPEFLK